MSAPPIGEAPRDLPTLLAQNTLTTLPHFTSDDAFTLGLLLHTRLRALTATPAVISISTASSEPAHLLFHACTHPGTTPDNDIWVARKRRTVLRWGVSSFCIGVKLGGDEGKFREKFALGDRAGEYAIHGGGVPVFVQGVEGVVAVVVVSGLKQEEDHMVVVEGVVELGRGMVGK